MSIALEDETAAAGAAPASCPSCAASLVGDYCHVCGEKRPEARDLSMRHFVADAAQELTNLDSKLVRTIFSLLFRPGFLTLEWLAGRRSRYLKPLNLFLAVFGISLFAYSAYRPVSIFHLGNILAQDRTGRLERQIEGWAERKQVAKEVLIDEASEKWQRYMSLSQLVFIGAFALVLQAVFVLTRRYFVEHLVFSLHFVSFSMLTVVLMWPIYFFIGFKSSALNQAVAVCKWLVDIAYMFLAVRTVYRLTLWRTVLASLVLVVGYFLSYVLVFVGTLIAAITSVFK